ncbi:beta-glucosidase BglX [Solitalea canadensis]|uniref:Periplasmic beta-glucosidase n=1 Tax=Solitalea canadensis (strain ATCC 29591 / DSM 3403 / JCM 21819 / LMG 8368 / NBRC 15130 / NCIMB 12057 / USAM 9D) TaxID=929556 RepID=H8KSS5_SOLCM|nr:beta-glucosidase BglX [Solitalea canadensis]AFD05219.1 beta-glucosidase-like glycosyl hydrolase [Solitalea canadensis DSM 3403]
MNKFLTAIIVCATAFSVQAQQVKDPKMVSFIDKLMSQMTLEEKIGQLNLPSEGDIITGLAKNSNIAEKIKKGQVGGMFNIKGADKIREIQRIAVEQSRMKIPMLFGMDVIHGYETVFPIPLGIACTWDMNAIEESARIAASEASADGISWTFSPMVDIARDPRWGRVSEGSGEDPYLGGQIAKAMVRGYQGKGNSFSANTNILACVKHFALYGAGEAGRDYNTVDMSRIRMYNEYLYPYQAAVEAGVGSLMASFNVVDNVPAHGNKWLLTDVLRKQWKFDGFTVADYGGVSEMVNHGVGDMQSVSAQALNAGLDMDMVSEGFLSTLKKSLEEGKVSIDQINTACRRVLEAKYKLGLFANPYKYCDLSRAKKDIYTQANRAVARKTASESFVLLKNEGNLLPLAKKQTIAVIGPLANTRSNMVGTWSVAAKLDVPATVVEGLKSVGGKDASILYAKGCNLTSDPVLEANSTLFGRSLNRDNRTEEELREEAMKIAAQSDVIVAAMGESSEMSGESSSRTDIGIPDVQKRLLKELLKTGKPVVLVLFAGRPMTLVWEHENIPAIINVWFGGSEAAYAIGDVLFGNVNPGGKLVSTFPRNVAQIPLFYNHLNTGRPAADKGFEKFRSNYMDEKNASLYPFGYGLSYTQFTYSDIKLSSATMNGTGEITASVTVTNSGKRDGAEVVQLYIRDLVGSISRPVKELKGFEKIQLKAGESKTVSFKITPELLKFYNSDLEHVFEPGEFDLMIGGNSQDVKTTKFTLQ